MSLHFGAGAPAEQHQLQRAGVRDVRRNVKQVFACPPRADDRAERVPLCDEGYRERQRQGKLEQASAEDGHEAAEWEKEYMARFVKHQVRKMKNRCG